MGKQVRRRTCWKLELAISAMLDSQPSVCRVRASYPDYMINKTAAGELLGQLINFMLPEPLPHPLVFYRL